MIKIRSHSMIKRKVPQTPASWPPSPNPKPRHLASPSKPWPESSTQHTSDPHLASDPPPTQTQTAPHEPSSRASKQASKTTSLPFPQPNRRSASRCESPAQKAGRGRTDLGLGRGSPIPTTALQNFSLRTHTHTHPSHFARAMWGIYPVGECAARLLWDGLGALCSGRSGVPAGLWTDTKAAAKRRQGCTSPW
ncbi:hypothetical protein BS50DRAFT_588771 [Corynespora cassiicola Philippines]|uniref:Uncharacterized protein n=1 Tax=Corynespora cassiicola Philippines TaxID=1448308 RepID=A0A2T2NKM7_CORCC|nr:hypothetical protein BS50DRAFT_588771 [Corynespora cassiicola Philippines]